MSDIKLEELLDRIYEASAEELNPILNAVTERFSELWPQWELATLSVQGHDRQNLADAMLKSIDLLGKSK